MHERKKALFISPIIPRKDGIGVQQRAYRNLHLLTSEYDVDAIFIAGKNAGIPDFLKDLDVQNYFYINDQYIDIPPILSKITGMRVLWRLGWMTTRTIRTWIRRREYSLQLRMITKSSYALTMVFRIRACWLHDFLVRKNALYSETAIVDFDDIESKAKKRILQVSGRSRGVQKYISIYADVILARLAENRALKVYDDVWVCSEIDKQDLEKKKNRKASITAMPNTIYLTRKLPLSSNNQRIMFLGAMNYFPNIDAAEFFCKDVLPKFEIPVEFFIVGGSPSDEVKELAKQKGVTVTGRVENLEDYYRDTDIVVVPIRFGGGTRIKILEAMAFGRLVISTSVGCEGIGANNNHELVIADTANDFVKLCTRYLEDQNNKASIETNARRFVEERYCFENALTTFQKNYS